MLRSFWFTHTKGILALLICLKSFEKKKITHLFGEWLLYRSSLACESVDILHCHTMHFVFWVSENDASGLLLKTNLCFRDFSALERKSVRLGVWQPLGDRTKSNRNQVLRQNVAFFPLCVPKSNSGSAAAATKQSCSTTIVIQNHHKICCPEH